MRFLSIFTLVVFVLCGQPGVAGPITTVTRAPSGTRFVVSVDWETKAVLAQLRANPARLAGHDLEQAMQLAVYYSTAVDCRMAERGRKVISNGKIAGSLHCPWFN